MTVKISMANLKYSLCLKDISKAYVENKAK